MMVELVDCSEVVVVDAPGSVIDTNGVSQHQDKPVTLNSIKGNDTKNAIDWRTDMWIKTKKSFQNRVLLALAGFVCDLWNYNGWIY